jgi:hypothetical protein
MHPHVAGQRDRGGDDDRDPAWGQGSYAVKYNVKGIAMQPYDESVATRARKLRAEMVEAERQCTRKANPDFDTVLN